jgi:hypothetical protein
LFENHLGVGHPSHLLFWLLEMRGDQCRLTGEEWAKDMPETTLQGRLCPNGLK